ncbi:MAG: hypothetical protein CVU57_15810 [Deltaproteobacteria bacterium HGW-Deltaproteobacteria-15]|jgi:CRP-like cAMP-binding protein|nr:MAG: hypothetical protein CVU57_15810 [Deltaproteobacteria bacterium HGW-Deltaproteobacteria-15]
MAEKPTLEGNLGFTCLADIFQILGGNSSTGILRITTPYYPYPGFIHFVEGNPIHATCGDLSGLEAINPLFGWAEGRFEFEEGEVHTARLIKKSGMQIVLDALRLLDNGDIRKLGPRPFFHDTGENVENCVQEGSFGTIQGPPIDFSFVIEEEEFRKGEKILRQGAHGKWIWVILEGAVSVNRETSFGTFTVATLQAGCFIGSFRSLLFHDQTRTAHVRALEDVRLGLLDTERLSRIFTSLTVDFQMVLLELDRRLSKITDRAAEVFTSHDRLPDDSRFATRLLEEGSTSEELSVILDGEAMVVGKNRTGRLPLLSMGRESVFGSIPFVDMGHEPRFAYVTGTKDLRTRALDVEALYKEYNQLPPAFRNLIHVLGLSIYHTTGILYDLHEKREFSKQ